MGRVRAGRSASGTRERDDVRRWVECAQANLGGRLWLHGVSMGAATVLMAAGDGFPGPVEGIVADSSFSSPRDVLAYQMTKQYHLPQFPFVPIGTLAGMLIAGRDFACGSVVRAVARSEQPMLFVCGAEDREHPARFDGKAPRGPGRTRPNPEGPRRETRPGLAAGPGGLCQSPRRLYKMKNGRCKTHLPFPFYRSNLCRLRGRVPASGDVLID